MKIRGPLVTLAAVAVLGVGHIAREHVQGGVGAAGQPL